MQKNAYLRKETESLSTAVEKLNAIREKPSEFNDRYKKAETCLAAVYEGIPREPMISVVINQITKPMDEFGVSLISITPLSPIKQGLESNAFITQMDARIDEKDIIGSGLDMTQQQVVSGKEYARTPIELTLQSGYKQFGMYLNALRQMSRIIVVDEFVIRENKEISPKLDIKLKISVFHYGKE
jgi:hypothetical protein